MLVLGWVEVVGAVVAFGIAPIFVVDVVGSDIEAVMAMGITGIDIGIGAAAMGGNIVT